MREHNHSFNFVIPHYILSTFFCFFCIFLLHYVMCDKNNCLSIIRTKLSNLEKSSNGSVHRVQCHSPYNSPWRLILISMFKVFLFILKIFAQLVTHLLYFGLIEFVPPVTIKSMNWEPIETLQDTWGYSILNPFITRHETKWFSKWTSPRRNQDTEILITLWC